MDESWRMKMGLNIDPFFSIARRSMDARINAEDFADVFGGPPRSVLTRKFSGDFSRSDCFYDEIFRPPGISSGGTLPSSKSHGRNLPAFRIPSGGDGFYDGVFGGRGGTAKEGSKKQSPVAKSRSNSSSMLTSEEVSPHYPPPPAGTSGDDAGISSFTSRLRPLNVPSRSHKRESKKQSFPAFPTSFAGNDNTPEKPNFYCKNPHFGGSRRSSPETMSFRKMEDLGPSSPASSPVSSLDETEEKQRDYKVEQEDDEDEMSSYVIEINSDRFDRNREGGSGGGGNSDSNDMDEAIAWARERSQRPETKHTQEDFMYSRRSQEEEAKSEEEMEMEMKDEEIRVWLTGKETNIRLLLSTLHHVLWSNSNWQAIPLANLRDGSQVKKAYQKARLCLHPDKLQQRGGTSPLQKSVASRVFSILQEAWAVYVTNEGLSS
ncbi:unnamed protein product [Eruca vesicaria subsp. sativa]|uniref:Uncharacterized protein n=1 Tax=Eruca vesicaria subsp. sativa TaxID=29727 RepID=A0ABC8KFW7_ERUVS|nr:unnamed protein product [Eruca vesicaria subsp. sativa]